MTFVLILASVVKIFIMPILIMVSCAVNNKIDSDSILNRFNERIYVSTLCDSVGILCSFLTGGKLSYFWLFLGVLNFMFYIGVVNIRRFYIE